jgi:hypothetical protein
MLGQQRRQGQGTEGADAAPAEARKPSPNQQAAEARAAAESQTTPQPKPADTAKPGASALERALGVDAPPSAASDAPDSGGIEIEGQRYSTAQLREAVLKAGDYTKKMQEVADGRRHLQAQQEALATVLPYIQPELARLGERVQNVPQRPDPALLETNPQQYLRDRAVYEQAVEEQQRLGNLTALQQQAHNRAMEQQVAQANEALAKEFPFWGNPQERQAAQAEIVEWATTKGGFSQDELRGLTSPHHLKAMMKAAMFDRMMAGAKTTAPTQRLAAPVRGSPPPAPISERIQQAETVFADKSNVRNAAALLAARRQNGLAR